MRSHQQETKSQPKYHNSETETENLQSDVVSKFNPSLAHNAILQPSPTHPQAILQLQRQYGNRYVNQQLKQLQKTAKVQQTTASSSGEVIQRVKLPFRNFRHWLGKKTGVAIGGSGQQGVNERRNAQQNSNPPVQIIDNSNSNLTSDYKIEYLVKKIDVENAKTILNQWWETTKEILKNNNYEEELQLRLEASEHTLKPMIEMLDEAAKFPNLAVWQTMIKTNHSEGNEQAIAIVNLSGSELVVNYLATAPINIYGTEKERVKGAGTSLMVAAIRKAKKNKQPITLHADANAVIFYKKMGFQTTKNVGEDWEMELKPNSFDVAETYLRQNKIGVEDSDILATENKWNVLDKKFELLFKK